MCYRADSLFWNFHALSLFLFYGFQCVCTVSIICYVIVIIELIYCGKYGDFRIWRPGWSHATHNLLDNTPMSCRRLSVIDECTSDVKLWYMQNDLHVAIQLKLENVAIANALQLEAARRHAVPVRFNTSSVASLKSLGLSVAVLEHFYCWYITLRCDLELWPRELELWPWTCIVDRLRHGQTLYEIWAKSDNPRRSYCSLNIWPYDLQHVSRTSPRCAIVCTKFKLSQAIRLWNVTIFSC